LGFTDSMSALNEHLEVGIQQGSDLLSQLTVEQEVLRSVTRLHIVALDEQNESADRAAGEQGDMSIVSSCGAGSSHLYPMPSTPCELGSFQLTVPYNGFPTPCPPCGLRSGQIRHSTRFGRATAIQRGDGEFCVEFFSMHDPGIDV